MVSRLKAFPYPELNSQILFVNIGYDRETFFSWTNPDADVGFTQIDVLGARNYPGDVSDYIHLVKKDTKLVFRLISNPECGFKKTIFLIGGTPDCQYQVMEAFIEYLSAQWYLQFNEPVIE